LSIERDLGFVPSTSLHTGLSQTIRSFMSAAV
jgi:hypothetical protein